MPLRKPKFQENLFEHTGAGPLIREDIIPEIDEENITIVISGHPISQNPVNIRPDMVVNKYYSDLKITSEISTLPIIQIEEQPIAFRTNIVIDSPQPPETIMATPFYQYGTKSLIIFKNGRLLSKDPTHTNIYGYQELQNEEDPSNPFSNKVKIMSESVSGDKFTFWVI